MFTLLYSFFLVLLFSIQRTDSYFCKSLMESLILRPKADNVEQSNIKWSIKIDFSTSDMLRINVFVLNTAILNVFL